MNVDLAAAKEAARDEIYSWLRQAAGVDEAGEMADAALDAAYPHVFAAVVEALRARAEGEAAQLNDEVRAGRYRTGIVTANDVTELHTLEAAARWLARIAQEEAP